MSNQEHIELHARIAFLEQQLRRYQMQEEAIVQALAQARSSARNINEDARRKADQLLRDSDMVIRDARRITSSARSIMEQAELEGQQRLLSARVEADKLRMDTQIYCERMNKETESHVRTRLTELQRLVEESQRTLEATRTRMAYIIRENMDNIRHFMNKISQLRNDSEDEDLRNSLNESLRQMQEFVNAFHGGDRMSPLSASSPARLGRDAGLDDDAPENGQVWTVQEVMRSVEKSGPQKPIPKPTGELLSGEALDKLPILPGEAPPAAPAAPAHASPPAPRAQTEEDAFREQDGKLDDLVDEGLAERKPPDAKADYAPRTAYSVDERLDDIISRMIQTEEEVLRRVSEPLHRSAQPQQAQPPQRVVQPQPQRAPQAQPQQMSQPSQQQPQPQPPQRAPQPQQQQPPQAQQYQQPPQMQQRGTQPPQAQAQPLPQQTQQYQLPQPPPLGDDELFVEGLQLRRGGHSDLSSGARDVQPAMFIRANPEQYIRSDQPETLPDDFIL